MSGRTRPISCCDSDCAYINGCRIGGYQCERCGLWYCGNEINEEGLCVDCEKEAEAEEDEEGDEE